MSRRLAALVLPLALGACAGKRPPPTPPLLPTAPVWKTLFGDQVVSPLAADSRRFYVATRDGAVRALDQSTGAVVWTAEGMAGRVSAVDGFVLVRGEDGTLWSLQPRSGTLRWKADTGVAGVLPAVLDGDRALVAGRGMAAVELATGRVLWSDGSGAETTAPPAATASRIFAGERDGTLRCRDRATGLSLWALRTGGALLAPPLVDAAARRLYLGTTDRRVVEVTIDRGVPGWSWRVGADVGHPGLLLPGRVLFASFDAVLHALHRGGNLAWRAALPARPLSAPTLAGGYVVVACLENEIVAFDAQTGLPAGVVHTAAEIRTPPVVAGGVIAVGLRDRSVISYAPPALAPRAAPEPEPVPEQAPPAPPLEAPPAGR